MGEELVNATIPAWRQLARRGIRAPGIRFIVPGWPDAGRRIVQSPALSALLGRAIAGTPDLRVALNAGAGEGLHTGLIQRMAGHARLIEFDMSKPAAAAPGTARFCASLTAIPLQDRSVDLAVCTEVLEHVPDDDRAVAELRRVLTPQGALVLSVPTPPAVYDAAHVREGYTLPQLAALFERHGLVVTDARYCMHALFKLVLQYWRPNRMPLAVIVGLAWLDRIVRPGAPMDLVVLARPRPARGFGPC
jgi:SAM-dependent methyltransferase